MASGIPVRVNGQVIDETFFNVLKTCVDDLLTVQDLIKVGKFLGFRLNGPLERQGVSTQILTDTVRQNVTLLGALLIIETAGSSGDFEIDVRRKRGVGAFTTLFSIKPKIPSSAGNLTNSDSGVGATAAVINTGVDTLLIDDILRLDITSIQGGKPRGIAVYLLYKATGA